jgi:hypothetical protein
MKTRVRPQRTGARPCSAATAWPAPMDYPTRPTRVRPNQICRIPFRIVGMFS